MNSEDPKIWNDALCNETPIPPTFDQNYVYSGDFILTA